MFRKIGHIKKKCVKKKSSLSKPEKPIQDNLLTILPNEALLHILSYLSVEQLVLASCVSRHVHALASDNALWLPFFKRANRKPMSDHYLSSYIEEAIGLHNKKPAAISSEAPSKYPSHFSNIEGIWESGLNTVCTLVQTSSGKINCFIEFCEEQQFYILKLSFVERGKKTYLLPSFITSEHAKHYNRLMQDAYSLTFESAHPGAEFAHYIQDLFATNKTITLHPAEDSLSWLHQFLKTVIRKDHLLRVTALNHYFKKFRDEEPEQIRHHGPSSGPRCFIR